MRLVYFSSIFHVEFLFLKSKIVNLKEKGEKTTKYDGCFKKKLTKGKYQMIKISHWLRS